TAAATSTWSGGISTAGLSSSDGLTLTGGNVLYSAANFVVQSGGNVGIGTTSPGKLLALDGSAAIRNALNVGGTLKATSTVFFTGLTANTAATSALCSGTDSEVWVDSTGTCDGASSRRFKYDIEPLGSALERVMALTPVSFKYHGQEKARYGFIAEDVLTIDPTVVALDAEGNSAGLYYKDISILAIKALQELNVKLDALTAQSGSTPTGNLTVASIESATNRWSLDENGGLVVQDLEVRGEGITIYDRDTKQPYCIGIASGEWFKEPGVCGNTAAQSPSSSNVQEQDQSSSDDGADNAWSNVPAEEENGAPSEEDEDDVNAALGS
ncbi:MAG: tail fiber domain-containing protein, partial [Patescibacteria group bacterium]|nr:tail fiber domain-containing protein [Patescibacteria group bacterium]